MSETPQEIPKMAQDSPYNNPDVQEAYTQALDRDYFETRAARQLSAIGVVQKALEQSPSGMDWDLRKQLDDANEESVEKHGENPNYKRHAIKNSEKSEYNVTTRDQEVIGNAVDAHLKSLMPILRKTGRGGSYPSEMNKSAATSAKYELERRAKSSLEIADRYETNGKDRRNKAA